MEAPWSWARWLCAIVLVGLSTLTACQLRTLLLTEHLNSICSLGGLTTLKNAGHLKLAMCEPGHPGWGRVAVSRVSQC
jgi:hypothetical protein